MDGHDLCTIHRRFVLMSKVVDCLEEAADAGKACADTISILVVARRM